MKFENPFVLGSGPPGTNGKVIARSYERAGAAWSQDHLARRVKVINTAPRYAKLRARARPTRSSASRTSS
jgi:dihydroorotate dehydrogenase